jgi:hypothetical protein
MISGHVFDRLTGRRIAGAEIRFLHLETGAETSTESNSAGFYAQPRLSPGTYSVDVRKKGYQSLETTELTLFVAGRLDLDFPLRPAGDVYSERSYFNGWAAGLAALPPVIHFYAADIETRRPDILPVLSGEGGGHQSAVSYVIDARLLEDIPLIGRDAYTALATLAGVTSDTTTGRSLGLSVNGQRPSASNFLLDGVENNSYLLTGPTVTVAPEAIAEYRVSTNNFSAEYGGTSGFIANVVSRAGGEAWHGKLYSYLKNEAGNANHFQRNATGRTRVPLKEMQTGLSVAGPLGRGLFAAMSFEALRFRSRQEEQTFRLPNTNFVPAAGSIAEGLLRGFSRVAPGPAGGLITEVTLTPPSSLERYLALPRIDQVIGNGNHRLMYRVAVARMSRPDLVWTPYPEFVMPLNQNLVSPAVAWTGNLAPNLTFEARGGGSLDDLRFDRPRSEIPFMQAFDNTDLPGSPTYYSFRNRSRHTQALGNVAWLRGRHVIKAGGGLLTRTFSGYLSAGGDGVAVFRNLEGFGRDDIRTIYLTVPREGGVEEPLDFSRKYRHSQFFAFLQDDVRLRPRLTVNLGLRYESGGAPANIGATKDSVIRLGGGSNLPERLAGAEWFDAQKGRQQVYPADRNDWAGRAGFVWSPGRNGRAVVRGAYGIFYDRPFDNVWINLRKNNYAALLPMQRASSDTGPLDYSRGLRPLLPLLGRNLPAVRQGQFRSLLLQPDLRSAYVQSFFAGVRSTVRQGLAFEVNGLGSLGRKLITSDVINRRPRSSARFSDLYYRGNQGTSEYLGLSAVADYRRGGAVLRLSYTMSRMFDIQSEALEGDFFDLRPNPRSSVALESTFARQYDSAAEWGLSNFDQRHNLTLLSVWDIPGLWGRPLHRRLTRNWTIAAMGAIRSGFPFTVIGQDASSAILRNRADLVLPDAIAGSGAGVCLPATPGFRLNPVCGVRLLNPEAFRVARTGELGDTVKNQFRGPGLFSLDLSLSRSFPMRMLGEAGRFLVRVDAFNVLNHVNLNNPAAIIRPGIEAFGPDDFGIALYGREGRATGFPTLTPFTETPRQIQLLLRIEF